MDCSFNLPINSLSFGQLSVLILKELYRNKTSPLISLIGNNIDLSAQEVDKTFLSWLESNINKFAEEYSRELPIFKLWHLNGSLESFSKNQILLSFYELDSPTKTELNIIKNNNLVCFSSKYTCEIFKSLGCKNIKHLPLAFDEYNFKKLDKKYFPDRITFLLVGKLEKRKHHEKIIKAWVKKYGNNKKYSLQCAIYNPFLKAEDQSKVIAQCLDNKDYYNVSFLNFMNKNSAYNDFLNSGDIVIGMSGGEGWGLPEFNALALGKHGVIINAHAYKDWANENNAILVEPNKTKIPAEDGLFFNKNSSFNQGNIFDFNEKDFIEGCEQAVARFEKNKINSAGLLLQKEFSQEKLIKNILNLFN
jgi:glycosyltransferase involved in cell wall biosynthesis